MTIGLHLSGCGLTLKATLAFAWNRFGTTIKKGDYLAEPVVSDEEASPPNDDVGN